MLNNAPDPQPANAVLFFVFFLLLFDSHLLNVNLQQQQKQILYLAVQLF